MQTTQEAVNLYSIRPVLVSDKEQYEVVCRFRDALTEEGYDSHDDKVGDDIAEIYLCYLGSKPVMTFRTIYTPNVGYFLARIAIPASQQKNGHGSKLLPQVLALIDSKLKPGEKIALKAKPSLFGFYAKFGFYRQGPEQFFRGVNTIDMFRHKSGMQKL